MMRTRFLLCCVVGAGLVGCAGSNDGAPRQVPVTSDAPERPARPLPPSPEPADPYERSNMVQAPAPAPVADPDPRRDWDTYEPSWWTEDARRVVTAVDAESPRESTREAARAGLELFKRRVSGAEEPVTRTETVRLSDGRYRTFFLAQMP